MPPYQEKRLPCVQFVNLGTSSHSYSVGGWKFVPNISFGAPVLEWVRPLTRLPVDVHMMVREPGRFIADFARVGATTFTVHVEACAHLHATLEQVRAAGMSAGVALNPATPVSAVEEVLPYVDRVLVMTVNPGYGGQAFIEGMTAKIAALAERLPWRTDGADLAVDGGIKAETARACATAGATVLVSGTGILHHPDGLAAGVRALRAAVA